MAGLGRKDFVAGDVLSAADVDGYLMDQSVMKFANTSAVSSAVGTAIAEGMTFYLSDTDEQVTYDGVRFIKQNGGENLVANGDFTKWSRGTSFNPSATGYFTVADRYQSYAYASSATTVARQSFTPGAAPVAGYEGEYFLRITSTNNSAFIQSIIDDARTLAGQTVTLSFFAKSASGQTLTALEVLQDFGTGGSSAVYISGITAPTITTSWVRYTVSFAMPSISGKTIGTGSAVRINIKGAINNALDIWGVQLEAGAAVTPFKPAGGNKATDTATAGSAGFDGVLVATNSSSNPSGSGTPAWAGFDVAGKNKVINGGFDFWQRGTTITNPQATNAFTADRWIAFRGSLATGMVVSQQTSGLTGIRYSARVQRTAGNTGTDAMYFTANTIETSQAVAMQGLPVTVSFYAKVGANYSGAGSLGMSFITGTGTDQAMISFTGASTVASGNAAVTTSWARYSYTGVVATNATEAKVEFGYSPTGTAGANDWFEITGVQVEIGSVATPFSRAGGTLQGELAACQRYYFRFGGDQNYQPLGFGMATNGTSTLEFIVQHPVVMRTAPTSVESSGICAFDQVGLFTLSSVTLSTAGVGKNASRIGASATGLTPYRAHSILTNNSLSSYIGLNAEL